MNQQAIALLIKILNGGYQSRLEVVIEKTGIQHQFVVGLKELYSHRPGKPRAAQIGLDDEEIEKLLANIKKYGGE